VGLPVARWKSTYRRAVILTDLIVIALAFRIGLLVIDGRLQVPGAAVFGAVLIAAILGRPWDLRVLGQGAEEFRRLGSAVEQCLKPVDVDDREGRTFPVIE